MKVYNSGRYTGLGTDHLSDNTTSVIGSLAGLAGQIIDAKKSGANVSASENQLANLSAQTLAALNAAQQPQPQPIISTPIILAGIAAVVLIVVVLVFKK